MQALRAAGVVLASMAAAVLAAACAFAAAYRTWTPALGYGAGALGLALVTVRLFRSWVRRSPRHGGNP